MDVLILWLLFLPYPQQEMERHDTKTEVDLLINQIVESGQVLQIAEPSEDRAEPTPPIAPGDPPLLAFRYFEGQSKHRFGNLDLVMDDAGH